MSSGIVKFLILGILLGLAAMSGAQTGAHSHNGLAGGPGTQLLSAALLAVGALGMTRSRGAKI